MVACSITGTSPDYCNAFLYGISDKNIQKLQRVQNNLAHVVLKAPRQPPTEQMLSILHWLPIEHRIGYKMAVLMYKSVRFVQPAYLSELLHRHAPVRQTRSTEKFRLVVPTMRSKIGSRAFSHAAPSVWNCLPEDLKEKDSINSFKRGLKMHLFRSAYDC